MLFKDKFCMWIKSNHLIQVTKINQDVIIGRLIEYNEERKFILIYHEDEKEIYNINLSEIYEMKST
jgi:hypothetical protein